MPPKKRIEKRNFANHPVVWVTGFIASIIGIYLFINQVVERNQEIPIIQNAPLVNSPMNNRVGNTNIVPFNDVEQSFVPPSNIIRAIEVYVVPMNEKGPDTLTLMILTNMDSGALATVKKYVKEGYEGWVRFDMPDRRLIVTPSSPLYIRLNDTGKVNFGWRYSIDTFPNGASYKKGIEEPDQDFFFRVY